MIVTTWWERPLHQRPSDGALAVGDDCVVVHERHTRLVCLDRLDGTPRWDVPAGTWPRAVVIAGDRCLCLAHEGLLSCIDLATGAFVWRAYVPEFAGHLVAAAGTVVMGGWRRYTPLAGFRLADGQMLWGGRRPTHTVTPLAWGKKVLLGSGTNAWLIDPRSGEETDRWHLPEPLADTDDRPAFTLVGRGRCLAVCENGSVVDIRLRSTRVDMFFPYDSCASASAPVSAGDVVPLEAGSGDLAVDPRRGSVLCTLNVGRMRVRGVGRCDGGFVLAGRDGVLFRLDSGGRIVDRSRSAGRLTALRDAGAGELLLLTTGTLRMITLD